VRARLRVSKTSRRRAAQPAANGTDDTPARVEVPHLSLADFVRPAPPGWTGQDIRVDVLPDQPPEVTE
jgi:hypothetical protein